MDSAQIIAFVPCRKGSQRVKHKNIRRFADIEGGLTRIKMQQLVNCEQIDRIVVSTDDDEVIEICEEVLAGTSKSYSIDRRPKELATSETSTDDLIQYVSDIIPEGHILWTHVTSPFITTDIYADVINVYQNLKAENQADSLLTVTKHQKFFWNKDGKAINYDRSVEKWPRTQTMDPIYELNSGIFLCNADIYQNLHDRVGRKPFMYELNDWQSLDVDWEEDFELAEILWLKKMGKNILV